MTHFSPVTVLMVVSIGWSLTSSDQNRQPREAGEIRQITCNGTLRRPKEPDRLLNVRTPTPLKLYAFDELRCVGKGIISAVVYGEKVDVKESDNWYAIPDTNTESEKPFPGRVSEIKGTFMLDEGGNFPKEVPAFWSSQHIPLEAPPELLINIDNKTVSIGSSRFEKITFQADGREYELATRLGTMRASAEINGERLRIKASGPSGTTLETIFTLQPNGKLEVVRTIAGVVSRAIYRRVADEALFNLFETASNRPEEAFVFRAGDRIVAEVDNDISSTKAREGDAFTLTVVEPAQHKGAKVRGHVSGVHLSARGVELRLAFEIIVLPDGKLYRLQGLMIIQARENERIMEVGKEGTSRGAVLGITSGSTKGGGVVKTSPQIAIRLPRGGYELRLKRGTRITISAEQP